MQRLKCNLYYNNIQIAVFYNKSKIYSLVLTRYQSTNKKLNLGNNKEIDLKLNKLNKNIYKKIVSNVEYNGLMDKFMNNVCLSNEVKLRIKDCLFQYEYCRILNIYHFPKDLSIINNKEFISHLMGFIEGDGSFKSGHRIKDKRFVPSFCIDLNSDDVQYLLLILYYLNFNNKTVYYKKDNSSAKLDLGSIEDLSKIINLLDNNPFLTKKGYDYIIWKKIIKLEQLRRSTPFNNQSKRLDIYNEGSILANLINNYENIDNKLVSINDINKYINLDYIIGFIEAEGLFGIIKSNDKFQVRLEITQASLNSNILHGIKNYLNNLSVDPNFTGSLSDYDKLHIEKKKGKTLEKSKLTISNIDYHYFRIIPHFVNTTFYTKKYLDFIIWMIAVIIKKHGLDYFSDGRELLEDLKKTNNTNSKSTRKIQMDNVPLLNILKVISKDPIYSDLSINHENNYRKRRALTMDKKKISKE